MESAIVTKISEDLFQAMRDKDTIRKGVLQLLKAGIMNEGIKLRRQLTESEELAVISQEMKQTKDSLAEAEKAGRQDLAKSAKAKIAIIEAYLPKQLSAEEVTEQLILVGANKDMNIGQVMKLAMPVLKGKADGSLINKTVQEFLQK